MSEKIPRRHAKDCAFVNTPNPEVCPCQKKAHIELKTQVVQRCSACGTTEEEAPWHIAYVRSHGLCVV